MSSLNFWKIVNELGEATLWEIEEEETSDIWEVETVAWEGPGDNSDEYDTYFEESEDLERRLQGVLLRQGDTPDSVDTVDWLPSPSYSPYPGEDEPDFGHGEGSDKENEDPAETN